MRAIVPAWRQNTASSHWANELDQVFNSFFANQGSLGFDLSCDVEESDKYILFLMDLPGMDQKEINIEVKDSTLIISGERKNENMKGNENGKSYRGRHYGFFKHIFRLPKTVDSEKIEADYTNGVLKILLTKFEEKAPKKIEVGSAKGNILSQLLKSKEA